MQCFFKTPHADSRPSTSAYLGRNYLLFMVFYTELTELDNNSKLSYWKSEFNCSRKYRESNRKKQIRWDKFTEKPRDLSL